MKDMNKEEAVVHFHGVLYGRYPSLLMASWSELLPKPNLRVGLLEFIWSAHRPPGLSSPLAILWKWVTAEGTVEEHMSQICFLWNFCWNKSILEILRSPLLEIPNYELRTKEIIYEVS